LDKNPHGVADHIESDTWLFTNMVLY
jgi:hypothetical protein